MASPTGRSGASRCGLSKGSRTRYAGCGLPCGREHGCRSIRCSAGFSLVELLVVLSITSLLLALLMPALSHVREAARRIGCGSNLNQIALGLTSYADDHRSRLPSSVYTGSGRQRARPQEMMVVRRFAANGWDGLGLLYHHRYIHSFQVFYCPSHVGEHSLGRYESSWSSTGNALIYGNYHYRGIVETLTRGNVPIDEIDIDRLSLERPSGVVLVADGLRTRSDFNHIVGSNVIQQDLSVIWSPDPSRRIYHALPETANDNWPINQIWSRLDRYGED